MIRILCAIVGGIGNGKTLFLTYLAMLHYKTGYKIVSNYHLNIPNFPIKILEDIEKILKEYGKKIFYMFAFDEGWIYIDSRLSQTKKNVVWTRFMNQTRKVGFDVFITSQHIGQIDVRVRDVMDRFFFPQITKWEGKPRKSKPLEMVINCVQRNVLGNLETYKTLKFKVVDGWLNLYDTSEVIRSVDYLEGKF